MLLSFFLLASLVPNAKVESGNTRASINLALASQKLQKDRKTASWENLSRASVSLSLALRNLPQPLPPAPPTPKKPKEEETTEEPPEEKLCKTCPENCPCGCQDGATCTCIKAKAKKVVYTRRYYRVVCPVYYGRPVYYTTPKVGYGNLSNNPRWGSWGSPTVSRPVASVAAGGGCGT